MPSWVEVDSVRRSHGSRTVRRHDVDSAITRYIEVMKEISLQRRQAVCKKETF